ncbi:MAG: hypothetical protein ACLP5V_09075 [Candidatus Bathyarchaeia archaeon]
MTKEKCPKCGSILTFRYEGQTAGVLYYHCDNCRRNFQRKGKQFREI